MKNTVKSSDVKPSSQTNKTGKTNDTLHNTGGAAQNRQKRENRRKQEMENETRGELQKSRNKLKRRKTDSGQNYAAKSGGKERRENARMCVRVCWGGGGGGGQLSHHTSKGRSIRICLVWLASVLAQLKKNVEKVHICERFMEMKKKSPKQTQHLTLAVRRSALHIE